MRDLPAGALPLPCPINFIQFRCKLQPDISLHVANCQSFFGDSLNFPSFNKKNIGTQKAKFLPESGVRIEVGL
jgi:hypothetical protein